jgi:hypothetical protein
MCSVSAAHPLVDDRVVASPELALVDADLAARLREDLAVDDAFRPRPVPRPPYLSLLPDVVLDAADPPLVSLVDGHPDEPVPVVDAVVDALPDYVLPSGDETADGSTVDDLILQHEVVEVQEAPVRVAEPPSDYPVLPDLDERIDALVETEAALRKIREQLGGEQNGRRKARVRRRFALVSGLGAVAALAVLAVDVQMGIVHLPGF